MSKREKVIQCYDCTVEEMLWLMNGYKFKAFRKDGKLTQAGVRTLDKLERLIYALDEFADFNGDRVVRELEQVIDSAY